MDDSNCVFCGAPKDGTCDYCNLGGAVFKSSYPTIRVLMLVVILLMVSSAAVAQDTVYPLESIAGAENITLVGCNYIEEYNASYCAFNRVDVADDDWQSLLSIEAIRDVQIDYPQKWDVPKNTRLVYKISGDIDGVPMEVWIIRGIWPDGEVEYYLMPYTRTDPHLLDDGAHWGVHPDSGWVVDSDVILNIIAKIQDNLYLWKDSE